MEILATQNVLQITNDKKERTKKFEKTIRDIYVFPYKTLDD